MNTQEAIRVLEVLRGENNECGEIFTEAITHAIEHMKRGAPEGWQLVPKEPTKEMIESAVLSTSDLHPQQAIFIYKWMLADAPEPPQERKD
jgi:hypothetical protein